jgi:AcrR family transcriptional regulator
MRNTILTAAKRQFIREGSYAGTSMDSIAAEADVSKQTLYSYFDTKEALFLAVVKKMIGEPWSKEFQTSRMDEVETPQELASLLLEVMHVAIKRIMHKDYLALLRIILAEAKAQPEIAYMYRTQIADRVYWSVALLMQKAVKKGLLEGDAQVLARMLVGSYTTYVVFQGLLYPKKPVPPTDEDLRVIVMHFMMRNTKKGQTYVTTTT